MDRNVTHAAEVRAVAPSDVHSNMAGTVAVTQSEHVRNLIASLCLFSMHSKREVAFISFGVLNRTA